MSRWIHGVTAIAVAVVLSACGGQEQPSDTPAGTADTVAKLAAEAAEAAAAHPPADLAAKPAAPATAKPDAELPQRPAVSPGAKPAPKMPPEPPMRPQAKSEEKPVPEGPAPKIVSPEPVYDFGTLDNETKVQHDFIIRNVGDATLNIKNVRTSCGCTVAQPEKKVLEPGEETKVATTLSLRGRQGPTKKSVTVESNDPVTPMLRLDLEGTAIAPIMMDPRTVNFGRIDDDEVHERTVSLKTTQEDLTFHIESIECPRLPQIQTEVKTLEDGKSYQIAVRIAEALEPGNRNGTLDIRTDHPKHPFFRVNVFAQVIGYLDIAPPEINLRYSDDPEKTSTQYLRVSAGRVKEFTIKEVIAPSEKIKVDIEERGPNNYLIKLTDMPLTEELDQKELVVRTDLEDKPEVTIPFRVIKPRVRPPIQRKTPPRPAAPHVGRPAVKPKAPAAKPPAPPATAKAPAK